MGRKQASGNQVLFFTRLMFTANRFQRLDGTSCREWIRLIHSVVKSTKIINGLVGVWGYVGSVRLRVLIMTEPSGTAASYQTASLPTFAPVGPRPRWWTLRWPPPPSRIRVRKFIASTDIADAIETYPSSGHASVSPLVWVQRLVWSAKADHRVVPFSSRLWHCFKVMHCQLFPPSHLFFDTDLIFDLITDQMARNDLLEPLLSDLKGRSQSLPVRNKITIGLYGSIYVGSC